MPQGDGSGPCGGNSGRRGQGGGAGPAGNCLCPQCGHKSAHQRGTPCYQQVCPKCGAKMTRDV